MPDHKNQELNPYRKEIAEIPTVGATGLGLAIQMVTTAKEVIPEPAKGAVAALGYLLTLLQVGFIVSIASSPIVSDDAATDVSAKQGGFERDR